MVGGWFWAGGRGCALSHDAIDACVQGLGIDRRRQGLRSVKHLEGQQDVRAVEQLDAAVRVLHDGHVLPAQGIAGGARGLEDVALPVER